MPTRLLILQLFLASIAANARNDAPRSRASKVQKKPEGRQTNETVRIKQSRQSNFNHR